jgi:dephospho-CoA kinase
MMVIGLTGGIGMGKSTLSRQLVALGGKACSADAIVHKLLGAGGAAVAAVGEAFGGTVQNGAVSRSALRQIVFNDAAARKKLEAILHPLVVQEEERFVVQMRRLGARFVVLDIPLLFETGAQERCDITLLASAHAFVQRQRVLARKGMTEAVFAQIVKAQMPEQEKQQLADFIIPTGLGKAHSFACLKQIIRSVV